MSQRQQKTMIGMFVVVCVFLVGMLISQWWLVLYSGLVLIGISLMAGMRTPGLAAVYTLIYVVLFSLMLWLHFSQPDAYVLGWKPATFIALFLIWPLGPILGIVYGVWFARREKTAIQQDAKLQG